MSDEIVDILSLIVMCLIMAMGTVIITFGSIHMNSNYEKYTNNDKSVLQGESMTYSDPYVMTAYQAYMMGWVMDNHPVSYNSVRYINDNANVLLSPADYDYSYSARNIKLHNSVLPNLQEAKVTTAANWFRGTDIHAGKRRLYSLELTNVYNNGGDVEWTVHP